MVQSKRDEILIRLDEKVCNIDKTLTRHDGDTSKIADRLTKVERAVWFAAGAVSLGSAVGLFKLIWP